MEITAHSSDRCGAVEYQIHSLLRLPSRKHHELGIGLQCLEPAIEVRRGVFDGAVVDAAVGAEECGGDLGDQFLAGVGVVVAGRGKFAVEAVLGAGGVTHFVEEGGVVMGG